jgi:3-hydroxyisobutyrate dehydrogenase
MEDRAISRPVLKDDQSRSSRSVLIIGLGKMGIPMAQRIVRAGHIVRGYDLSAGARSKAREQGLNVVDSVEGCLRDVSVLLLMLPDSDAVEAVLDAPSVRKALNPQITVLDMSSSDPMRTALLAARIAETGAAFVDAPVSGGVSGAEAGRLTIMAGGELEVIDHLTPILSVLGAVKRTGKVGSGHAVKALNNLLSATSLLASSEVIHVGQRFGISPEVLLDVINASSGRSFSTEHKWPTFVLPETFDSGFSLELMVKDASIAIDLARAVGLPARLGDAVLGLWRDAASALPAGADHTEIAAYAAIARDPR